MESQTDICQSNIYQPGVFKYDTRMETGENKYITEAPFELKNSLVQIIDKPGDIDAKNINYIQTELKFLKLTLINGVDGKLTKLFIPKNVLVYLQTPSIVFVINGKDEYVHILCLDNKCKILDNTEYINIGALKLELVSSNLSSELNNELDLTKADQIFFCYAKIVVFKVSKTLHFYQLEKDKLSLIQALEQELDYIAQINDLLYYIVDRILYVFDIYYSEDKWTIRTKEISNQIFQSPESKLLIEIYQIDSTYVSYKNDDKFYRYNLITSETTNDPYKIQVYKNDYKVVDSIDFKKFNLDIYQVLVHEDEVYILGLRENNYYLVNYQLETEEIVEYKVKDLDNFKGFSLYKDNFIIIESTLNLISVYQIIDQELKLSFVKKNINKYNLTTDQSTTANLICYKDGLYLMNF